MCIHKPISTCELLADNSLNYISPPPSTSGLPFPLFVFLPPPLHKFRHLDVNPQPLITQGIEDRPQLSGVHLADERRRRGERLHEHVLGIGAALDGAVEYILGLGPELFVALAEPDVRDPEAWMVFAGLAALEGMLECRPRRVYVPRPCLVADREHATAEAVVSLGQDRGVQNRPHPVVDT